MRQKLKVKIRYFFRSDRLNIRTEVRVMCDVTVINIKTIISTLCFSITLDDDLEIGNMNIRSSLQYEHQTQLSQSDVFYIIATIFTNNNFCSKISLACAMGM